MLHQKLYLVLLYILFTGIFSPSYVNAQGQIVSAVGATGGAARSAIGRKPIVYVTLTNADGEIILAGFVKLYIQELGQTIVNTITLRDVNVPYICEWKTTSTWQEISGQLYEELNMSPEEFSNTYELATITDAAGNEFCPAYVELDGEMVNSLGNEDILGGSADFGSFTWNDDVIAGSHTQVLTLTIDNSQWSTWYNVKNAYGRWLPKRTTDKITPQALCQVRQQGSRHQGRLPRL